jgi:hypothetical protein
MGTIRRLACKNNENTWYTFSDDKITEIPADRVKNSSAYLLFYRKKQVGIPSAMTTAGEDGDDCQQLCARFSLNAKTKIIFPLLNNLFIKYDISFRNLLPRWITVVNNKDAWQGSDLEGDFESLIEAYRTSSQFDEIKERIVSIGIKNLSDSQISAIFFYSEINTENNMNVKTIQEFFQNLIVAVEVFEDNSE